MKLLSKMYTKLEDYVENKIETEIKLIITCISDISKKISKDLRYKNMGENSNVLNYHGESQIIIDILANDLFIKELSNIDAIGSLVSEENDEIIILDDRKKYCIAFDPLDGSSNVSANIPVGSIYAIYDDVNPRNGKIVSAGYIMYSFSTIMVVTVGDRVCSFVLDADDNWKLFNNNIRVPSNKIYSVNEGNYEYWNESIKKIVNNFKSNDFTLRYVGSMVADIHRTLTVGGIFFYPEDSKNHKGKLRQLYEVNPMSYIIELAGGISLVGTINSCRCLDVSVSDIHQKCPILCGYKEYITQYIE